MLNKSIIVLFIALFAANLNAESFALNGCDIDRDGTFDVVTAKKCKLNRNEVLACKRVDYRLSDSENIKIKKKLRKEAKRVRRSFTQLTCNLSDILATASEDEIAKYGDISIDTDNIWGRNRRGKIQKLRGIERKATKNALSKVCRGVRALRGCEVWKARASHEFSGGDPRSRSSSLIAKRGCPGSFNGCISVYDKKGNLVHKLGEYPNSISAYDSRHYGGYGCGDRKTPDQVGKEALANTGSQEIYLKDDQGICVRVPNADVCCFSSECGTGPGCGSL